MPRARVKTPGLTSVQDPCLPGSRSAAERAREKKLRDDPMAIVIGPLYVDCRRCGNRIKLSSKSPYDAFHWRTHRSRCLKKKNGTQRARKTKNTSPSPTTSGGITTATPPDQPLEPQTPNPCSNASHDPPLVDDNAYSASLDLLTSVASAALKKPDAVFDNCLTHSSRELPKPSSSGQRRRHQNEMDEMRMRQEAVESLALLSRSG